MSKDLKKRNECRKALEHARLYLILDTEVPCPPIIFPGGRRACPPIFKQPGRRGNYDALFEIARQAVAGGVDVIQLRDKKGSAKDILEFSKNILKFLRQKSLRRLIPFILNDRVDLALAAGADGVHVGQEDPSIAFARKMLGPQAIIGASCQNFKHAKIAEEHGADYIGFGSVFKTKTKPDRSSMDLKLLEEVWRKIKIPVFAIGGISLKNVGVLQQSGINRIAVCRAVCEAEDVQREATHLRKMLDVRCKMSTSNVPRLTSNLM